MKNIWSFTTVKDEEDIIESFVRYNMNVVDGMVISDNGSNDSTLDILKKLKKEGYNIDILVDESQYFDQVIKRNELLKYTIENHNPDIIFPLDADEFICAYKDINPKKEIEKLNANKLHLYKMENYILNGKEDNDEMFIPKKINNMRITEEEKNHNYKCIIPKKIYEKGIFLEMGSHTARYNDENMKMHTETSTKLFLAHYPARSKYQLINKIITGRLNNSSLHAREEGFGFHQYEILDEIIKLGTISDETLIDMSKTYSLVDKTIKVKSKKQPIQLKFCKNIDLKYTKKGNDDKLLSNTIKTSLAIINHMREENKKESYEYEKIVDIYRQELNKVLNSKIWKMKEFLLKPYRKFKKTSK